MSLERLKRASILQKDRQMTAAVEDSPEMQQLIRNARDLPFYRWGKFTDHHSITREYHDSTKFIKLNPSQNKYNRYSCCFNHLIGLPEKPAGVPKPMFDYQKILFQALEVPNYLNSSTRTLKSGDRNTMTKPIPDTTPLYSQKVGHLLLLKSTGIGATEFFIRYLIWKSVVNDDLKGSDICIITGPREQISIDIINRIRQLFLPLGITFDTKETTLFLNGVRIRSYPSNRLQDMRGLANVSIIYCDEAAFFDKNSQSEVIDVCERYAGKSRAKIIICSTPNKPQDLVHTLLQQPYEKSFYKVVKLDYTYSVGKLYSEEDIKIAKASDSFEREYNLQFAGVQGNVISSTAIDRCLQLGERMNETTLIDDWSIQTDYVMAIDAGYGSSNTAITVSRFVNGKVQLLYAKEFTRPNFSNIIDTVWNLKNRCPSNCLRNIIIDASNSELYTALSTEFNQNPSPKYLADKQAFCKKVNAPLENYLFVVPVPFSVRGREMLSHLKYIVEEQDEEDGSAMFALDKRFEGVVTCLRTAQATDGLLDKEATSFDDTLDSLRLNLSYYRRSV